MESYKYLFDNNQIDIIIPLGEECYTSQSIDCKFNISQNLRSFAFPFDYVGHTFIEVLHKKLEDMITTKKTIENNDFEIKLFGDKYFFSDSKYKLHYWHDVTHSNKEDFTESEIDSFVEKYKRRYERLVSYVESGKKILFLSVNHFDNIYNEIYKKESLIKLYSYLNSLNSNIFFLAINYDKDNFEYKNLYHINLDFNKYQSFEESKNDFQKLLYKYVNLNIKYNI